MARPVTPQFPAHGPVDDRGNEQLLSFRNVSITFGKGEKAVRAVKNATFDIYKGETFSLVGESGSGKTTIGRAAVGITPVTGGQILYKGVPLQGKRGKEAKREIQMVFQDPAASLNERATVEAIISEGLHNFRLCRTGEEYRKRVLAMMEQVGLLPEHLHRYPHEFSGGQRQRIGIARAMVMQPQLVIADEPISALDVSVRSQVLNLMVRFQQTLGVSYLFIAHDLSIVRYISHRIGVIYKGDIVEIAPAQELFAHPLHPYTKSLLCAIPIPDPLLEQSKVLRTYDPACHDYGSETPALQCIGYDHFVFGSQKEIETYRKARNN